MINMHEWLMGAWLKLLGYEPKIRKLPNEWLFFHFMKNEDVAKVLRRSWVHGKCFLVLHRCSLDFHPITNASKNHHLWLRMPGLSIQFWSIQVLNAIGNSIGSCRLVDPKCVGLYDKRVAWILLVVSFSSDLPANIDLEWDGTI